MEDESLVTEVLNVVNDKPSLRVMFVQNRR